MESSTHAYCMLFYSNWSCSFHPFVSMFRSWNVFVMVCACLPDTCSQCSQTSGMFRVKSCFIVKKSDDNYIFLNVNQAFRWLYFVWEASGPKVSMYNFTLPKMVFCEFIPFYFTFLDQNNTDNLLKRKSNEQKIC